MEFNRGAEVLSSDGESVGKLSRVVLDPRTRKVGYLIVERGMLFTEDKVVPMDFVEGVREGKVHLNANKEGLDRLDTFDETHYVPLDPAGEEVQAYYWYPPLSGATMGGYPLFPQPVFIERTERQFPENYVALKEGARVATEDGEHLGNVERIITDAKSDRATHFVISSGGLLKERRLIPTHWIKDVSEDEVRLSVEPGFLERLPVYEQER